jgi:hypothetical protein
MPGAVSMYPGAKFFPIVADALDRGDNINAIVPGHTTSKYPEAFARPFHPSAGPDLAT